MSFQAFYSSFSGVRQGEKLSPILFSLYLNDIENHLMHDPNAGLEMDCADDNIAIYLRLIVLLYADNTVILASNEHDLQRALIDFDAYCKSWKLNVKLKLLFSERERRIRSTSSLGMILSK